MLCGEWSADIKLHVKDAIALVEEILVERGNGDIIVDIACVKRVVPVGLRVGIEERLVGILHKQYELLLLARLICGRNTNGTP